MPYAKENKAGCEMPISLVPFDKLEREENKTKTTQPRAGSNSFRIKTLALKAFRWKTLRLPST
jgi:hypothetical protein